MQRLLRTTLSLFALGLVAPSLSAQSLVITDAVKESMRARVDNHYNVGIIVGVIDEAGPQYYSYGEKLVGEGQTPDARTVFEIGSITKVFTAIALARMAEEGKLTLDTPIDELLPSGINAPSRNGRSITLADISTHMSGLPRLPNNMAPADPRNPYADYTTDMMYAFLSSHSLTRDIGSQYEYSNFAVGLLGNLLAKADGSDFEGMIAHRITEPLGMPDTRITLTPDMRARLASGHAGSQPTSNWDIPALAGAGALRSTAADMLTFIAANSGLEATPLADAMQVTHRARAEAAATMKVGLGWHIRTTDNADIVWHNGGTGGYRSFIGFVDGKPGGVVVLTNSSTGADDIGFHLLDQSLALQEVQVSVDVPAEILDAYVGQYDLAPSMVLDVGRDGNHLTVQLTGQPSFAAYPASETEFFLTVVPARLTFERNADGNVTAVTLHQGGADQRAPRRP